MRVIGLMSGTSVDGIDTALVEIEGTTHDLKVQLISGATYPYPEFLREQILAICAGEPITLENLLNLDDSIAYHFSQAALAIESSQTDRAQLIGSHGQTVYHRPPQLEQLGYSLQLGRGEVIAQLTQRAIVNQFRQADLAVGGQGAPLVPKVDAWLLSHLEYDRCIQNIGGIGNLTYIPSRQDASWSKQILGWDTGPGNVLLDLAVQQLTEGKKKYDENGQWSSTGKPCHFLVDQWLKEDFFHQLPPKSTGRELFGLSYLEKCKKQSIEYQLNSADWLATLSALTVESIALSYEKFLPKIPDQVLLCGGGSHNLYLKKSLQERLGERTQVMNTGDFGLDANYKEAISFAVLAYWRYIAGESGNLPQVTGAKQPMLLGQIHLPS